MALARFLTFAVLVSLVTSMLFLVTLNINNVYAQSDRLWYVGEGVKTDMWVKYRIEELDTKGGRPFEMIIHFKEQQDGDWIAPVYVIDQGKVISGTVKFGSNLSYLSGTGTDIPAEMNEYISGYGKSIQWLESFTPQSKPQSLDAASWGRIACIGCEEIKPLRKETITVPAGTYETTVVGWHKSTNNDIWIVNDFPYPVKAQTYADVTTGQAPTQFAFELLATGTGQPDVPISEDRIPTPPLGPKETGRRTYAVSLDWEPAEIRPGSPVSFGIEMLEQSGFPLERVNYDFAVKDSAGNVVEEFKNENAELGIATHQVTFDSAGSMTVTVVLNSISGVPTGGGTFTESVDFDIVVVPEFPYSAAAIVAGVIGVLVLLTRARGLGPSGLFSGRNAV